MTEPVIELVIAAACPLIHLDELDCLDLLDDFLCVLIPVRSIHGWRPCR